MVLVYRSWLVVGELGVWITAVVPARVRVDQGSRQVRNLVEQRVPRALGDGVSLGDAEALVDRHLGLGVEAMADPAQADAADALDAVDLAQDLFRLGGGRRVNRVHH